MLGFGPFSSAPISALRGNSYAVALSETITLTTSAVGGNLIDTRMAWGVGEWGSGWWGSGPSLYDTLTLTDSSVSSPPVFATISETTSLSTSVVSTATYNKAVSDGQTIKASPDEIELLKSLAAALRVQENVKATVKLEGHLAA